MMLHGLPSRLKGLYVASRSTDDLSVGLGLCLEQAADENPDGRAIIFEGRVLSYREFNAWVNRIAHYLARTGTQKGDVVCVLIENRPELLASVAALAKLGAVAALLNTSQRKKVLAHSIRLVKPERIIVGEELIEAVGEVSDVLPKGAGRCLYLADTDTLSDAGQAPSGWENLASASKACSEVNPDTTHASFASDPCCYFYTSGTTGLPKAAVLTHGRFMKAYGGVGLASLQLKQNDRVYVTLPFYHATAMVIAWGSVLAGRSALVMARNFSASGFWPDVRRYQVTAICYVGELCRYLLAQPESDQDRAHRVRVMFGNGLRPGIWQNFKQRFGIGRVIEFYGSSEGNIGFLNLFNLDCTVGFTTVGYAIVHYDLDQDEPVRFGDGFMRRVKRGETGLLLGEISDKTPFDGYTDPEKTEQTILRNVFCEGDAWFNTGDLMRDQGYRHVQFVDRLGDTYRWKGENVSTTEVENVLSDVEGVLDAVVYGVEIPGASGRAGMASVSMAPGKTFDSAEVFKYLTAHLPAYAVPVFIRQTTEMAKTGTFKYKKTDLKKEGYDPSILSDPLWVKLPGAHAYCELNDELFRQIQGRKIRF